MSKIIWNCEKKIILLRIANKEKEGLRYLAVKKTICITKRNNFKTLGLFLLFELSSFLFEHNKKLQYHEKVCKNKDFCGIVIEKK